VITKVAIQPGTDWVTRTPTTENAVQLPVQTRSRRSRRTLLGLGRGSSRLPGYRPRPGRGAEAIMTAQSTRPPALSSDDAAVVLQWLRLAVGTVLGTMMLVWAHQLALRPHSDLITSAFLFVGLVFVIVVLAGMVPSKIKFGDIFEVELQQARGSGIAEGLEAGAIISKRVAAGHVPVDQVQADLHAALTSPGSLRVDGVDLPVAQLAPLAAKAKIEAIVDALTMVAKHSGGTS
jgi:hypothetical protein